MTEALNTAVLDAVVNPPTLVEVTLVPSPSLVATPGYSFSTSENGTISYAGGCSSTTTSAFSGDNTISFAALAEW